MGICCVNKEEGSRYEPLDVKQKSDKVTMSDFHLLKTIGRGTFGKVLMVQKIDTGKIYAMKVLQKKEVVQNDQSIHTRTERDVLASIKSPFIVELFYAFQTQDTLNFVMEFLNGGELFHHLRKEKMFTEERTAFYSAEILLALEVLHKNGVIYRDLKPENVLLDSEGHIKLTDFGLAKQALKDEKDKMLAFTFCGTPEYLAPEVIMGVGHNKSVDWWSLGIFIYEMLAGYTPFIDVNRKEILRSIVEKDVEMESSFSENATSLLKGLLSRDPEKRLGSTAKDAAEIKAHPFFSNIDWESLEEKKVIPEFRPKVESEIDCKNFDKDVLKEDVTDNPKEGTSIRKGMNFDGFTYQANDLLSRSESPSK